MYNTTFDSTIAEIGSDGLFCRPCDECRNRRVKCDREYPKCLRCVKRKFECTYLYQPKRKGPPKGFKKQNEPDLLLLNKLDCFKANLTYQISNVNSKKFTSIDGNSSEEHDLKISEQKIKFKSSSFSITTVSKLRYVMNPLSLKTGVIQAIFSNSMFDTSPSLVLTSNGKAAYHSDNPIGLLLAMYTLYHEDPKKLMQLKVSHGPPTQQNVDTFTKSNSLNYLYNLQLVSDRLTEAYFEYYHPYVPVIDKQAYFYNKESQSKVLINIVQAVGAAYLPDVPDSIRDLFSGNAVKLLKQSYYTNSYSLLAALLIMGNFQHNPRDCNHGFFYLGRAIRMGYSMGLDRPPPPKTTPNKVELRRRLWTVCHIMDKLYNFGMTRPTSHDYFYSCSKSLSNYTIDVIPSNHKLYSKQIDTINLLKAKCTVIYINLLSELCKMMYLMSLRFKFIESLDQSNLPVLEPLAHAAGQHLDKWFNKVQSKFGLLTIGSSGFGYSVVRNFILDLAIKYNGTKVQLLQNFSKLNFASNVTLSQLYQTETLNAACNGIQAAQTAGLAFCYFGNSYRFYALSACNIYLIHAAKNSTNIALKSKAKEHLIKAYQVYRLASNRFALAKECLKMLDLLIEAEGI